MPTSSTKQYLITMIKKASPTIYMSSIVPKEEALLMGVVSMSNQTPIAVTNKSS